MNVIQQLAFDYSALDVQTRAICVEAAERIRHYGKRAAESIVAIGEELSRVKASLQHGLWLPWLEAEFGWSDMTAKRFIQVYEMVKSNKLFDLPAFDVSALYLLAAPSTKPEVREEANAKASSGSRVTHADVVGMKQRVAERANGGWKNDNPEPAQLKPEPIFTYEQLGYRDEDHFAFQAKLEGWLDRHPFEDMGKVRMLIANVQDHWRSPLAESARRLGNILITIAEELEK